MSIPTHRSSKGAAGHALQPSAHMIHGVQLNSCSTTLIVSVHALPDWPCSNATHATYNPPWVSLSLAGLYSSRRDIGSAPSATCCARDCQHVTGQHTCWSAQHSRAVHHSRATCLWPSQAQCKLRSCVQNPCCVQPQEGLHAPSGRGGLAGCGCGCRSGALISGAWLLSPCRVENRYR
jgi:hypothetical protein